MKLFEITAAQKAPARNQYRARTNSKFLATKRVVSFCIHINSQSLPLPGHQMAPATDRPMTSSTAASASRMSHTAVCCNAANVSTNAVTLPCPLPLRLLWSAIACWTGCPYHRALAPRHDLPRIPDAPLDSLSVVQTHVWQTSFWRFGQRQF